MFRLLTVLSLTISFAVFAEQAQVASTDVPEDAPAPVVQEDATKPPEPTTKSRRISFSADVGGGMFTGGLGQTSRPGVAGGLSVAVYLVDWLAIEAGAQASNYLDDVISKNGSSRITLDSTLMPITAGLHFDTRPQGTLNFYFALGGGLYLRGQNAVPGSNVGYATLASGGTTENIGAYGGGGIEIFPGTRSFSFALDVRYHVIFFKDAQDTFGNTLDVGSRAGNYLSPTLRLKLSL